MNEKIYSTKAQSWQDTRQVHRIQFKSLKILGIAWDQKKSVCEIWMPHQQANLPLGLGSQRQRGLGEQGGAYQKAGDTKARRTNQKAGVPRQGEPTIRQGPLKQQQISQADPGNQVLPCQIYPIAQKFPMARNAPFGDDFDEHGNQSWKRFTCNHCIIEQLKTPTTVHALLYFVMIWWWQLKFGRKNFEQEILLAVVVAWKGSPSLSSTFSWSVDFRL